VTEIAAVVRVPTARSVPRRDVALDVRALSKTFGATRALHSLDLRITAGEVHALLGENGSGKSTLIRVLSGYHRPDPGGEIVIGGERLETGSPASSYALGCRVVHQDLGLVETMSVADNLCFGAGFPHRFGGIRTREVRLEAERDLARVGVTIDPGTPVSKLSAATKTGVAVARALRGANGGRIVVLVMDEATATLPEPEVELLLSIVRSVSTEGVAVLYVTHRLDEVFEVADTVTVLRDGRKVAERKVAELSRPDLLELLVGEELQEARHAAPPVVVDSTSDPVLCVRDLSSGTGTGRIRGLSFDVRAGEIVGIAGITGSGRETVLQSIFGAVRRDAGSVTVSGAPLGSMRPDLAMELGAAYLPGDRRAAGGIMGLSGAENLTLPDLSAIWRAPSLRHGVERQEVVEWFGRLHVRPLDGRRALSTFSGGNQQKILFGKWLRRHPRLLLLDEPTQGVDVAAKGDLHREIQRSASEGAGVVVSSADADELVALCHRVLVLRQGTVVAELQGAMVSVSEVSRASLGSTKGPRSAE
jgi:ribose transport system ATP-binding protein